MRGHVLRAAAAIVLLGLVASASVQAAPLAQVAIVGAQPAEARELRAILRTVGDTGIESIQLAPLGPRNSWKLPPDRLKLSVRASTTVRGDWEAGLLADLYLQAIVPRRLREIGVVTLANGSFRAGHIGALARVDLNAVRGAFDGVGVSVVELRRLGGGAVVVVVRAPDPAAILSYGPRRALDAGGVRLGSAVYLGVEDGSGRLVYEVGQVRNYSHVKGARP